MIAAEEGAPGTLGALQAAGWNVHAHCRDRHCWRNFAVDMEKLVAIFGPDAPLADRTFSRVVCQKCGCREAIWRFSRPAVRRAASAYISPPGGPIQPRPPRETEMERNRRLADITASESVTIPGIERMPDAKRPRRVYRAPDIRQSESLVLDKDGAYGWKTARVKTRDFAGMVDNDNRKDSSSS